MEALTTPAPALLEAPTAATVRTRSARVPLLVLALLLALVLPSEFSYHVGGLRLTAYRVVLLLAFAPCLTALLTGRAGRAHAMDVLVFLQAGWLLLAMAANHGPARGLESGGVLVLEGLGAYLLARTQLRTPEQFRAFARAVFALVVLVVVVALPEAFTGRHYVHDLAGALAGGSLAHDMQGRFGLTRAFGPFDHPILCGTLCATTLGLALHATGARREGVGRPLGRAVVCALGAIASVSSGAFLAYLAQVGLATWERATRRIRHPWLLLGSIAGTGFTVVALFSNRNVWTVLAWYLSLDRHTAYNRVLVWQHGLAEVRAHPVFGIGLEDWTRPGWMSGSMDAFWLVQAVRYGLPTALLLAAAVVLALAGAARVGRDGGARRAAALGWGIALAGLAASGVTVHYWNQLHAFFFLLLGAGVHLLLRPPVRRARGDTWLAPRGAAS